MCMQMWLQCQRLYCVGGHTISHKMFLSESSIFKHHFTKPLDHTSKTNEKNYRRNAGYEIGLNVRKRKTKLIERVNLTMSRSHTPALPNMSPKTEQVLTELRINLHQIKIPSWTTCLPRIRLTNWNAMKIPLLSGKLLANMFYISCITITVFAR